jgi:cytochrome c oxidase subunit 2
MFPGISWFPEQASSLAADVDHLYYFITAVAAFFALVVTIFVIYFAAKYRTSDPMAIGARIEGSIPLELAWSIVPFLISIVIFVWSASVFFDLYRPPDQTLEIYATGKRWMWKFQHLGGQNEINELHVPLGRPVKITFTSEDVLHSMFFPAFRIKADAIPGRYSSLWFTATKLGQFHLFCAEYCGTKHSGMVGSVFVMEPTAYQAWLGGGGPGASLVGRGEQLFNDLACNACHRAVDSDRGPTLLNRYGSQQKLADGSLVAVNETYVRESILMPQAKVVAGFKPLMPTFQGLISEENVMALVEYVKSLRASSEAGSRSDAAATTGATPQENK